MKTYYLNVDEVDEVAELLKTTRGSIYQRIRKNLLPKDSYFRVGKRIYFNAEKLCSKLEKKAG